MQAAEATRAVAAAKAIASALGLTVDDAVVLQNSNKLSVRLRPCDVLARMAPEGQHLAPVEIELAQRLAEAGCPVAALEPRVAPRVYERDGFDTLGGLIMARLGRIPVAQEVVEVEGARLTVQKMEGRRIIQVLVQRQDR